MTELEKALTALFAYVDYRKEDGTHTAAVLLEVIRVVAREEIARNAGGGQKRPTACTCGAWCGARLGHASWCPDSNPTSPQPVPEMCAEKPPGEPGTLAYAEWQMDRRGRKITELTHELRTAQSRIAEVERLLNERDDFIVARGLWSEFTAALRAGTEAQTEKGGGSDSASQTPAPRGPSPAKSDG